jgi:predicted nucleic acid-binding protein
MDVCCLGRPFDDLSQDKIYLEAEAVLAIISRCENAEWILVSSAIIDVELSKLRDIGKLEKIQAIYATAKERFSMSPQVEQRAEFLRKHGIKEFDSFHMAIAEIRGADVLLTTDDRFLRAASKLKLNIKISNPVTWFMGVIENE